MLTEFKLFSAILGIIFIGCGNVSGNVIRPRIIGGTPTSPGEFPWMVSIQYNTISGLKYSCGGALINQTTVVTAAHCMNFELTKIRMVAGAQNVRIIEPSQQGRTPISVYIHPDYQNNGVVRHDLAIVTVHPPFVLNERVSPILLPTERHISSGYCWIAGWGLTENYDESDVLIKASVPIVSRQQCQIAYPELDPESQICAGHSEGGVDVCTGDTGGPLMCSDIGRIYFAGIASWGFSCAQPNSPGVYTAMSYYTQNVEPATATNNRRLNF